MEVNTIGLDLAKNVFQVHGADAPVSVLFRKKLRRDQVVAFFAAQPTAQLQWRRAPAAITGHGKSKDWGTMSD